MTSLAELAQAAINKAKAEQALRNALNAVNNINSGGNANLGGGNGGGGYSPNYTATPPPVAQVYAPAPAPVQIAPPAPAFNLGNQSANLVQQAVRQALFRVPTAPVTPPPSPVIAFPSPSNTSFNVPALAANNPFDRLADQARGSALTSALASLRQATPAPPPIAALAPSVFGVKPVTFGGSQTPAQTQPSLVVYQTPDGQTVVMPDDYVPDPSWTKKATLDDPNSDAYKHAKDSNSYIDSPNLPQSVKDQAGTPGTSFDVQGLGKRSGIQIPFPAQATGKAATTIADQIAQQAAQSQSDLTAMQQENAAQQPADRAAVQQVQANLQERPLRALANASGNQQAQDQQRLESMSAPATQAPATTPVSTLAPNDQETIRQLQQTASTRQAIANQAQRQTQFVLVTNKQTNAQQLLPAPVWDGMDQSTQDQFNVLAPNVSAQDAPNVQQAIETIRTAATGNQITEAQRRQAETASGDAAMRQQVQATEQGRADLIRQAQQQDLDRAQAMATQQTDDQTRLESMSAPPTQNPAVPQSPAAMTANEESRLLTGQQSVANQPTTLADATSPDGQYVRVRVNASGEEESLPIGVWNSADQGDFTLIPDPGNTDITTTLATDQAMNNQPTSSAELAPGIFTEIKQDVQKAPGVIDQKARDAATQVVNTSLPVIYDGLKAIQTVGKKTINEVPSDLYHVAVDLQGIGKDILDSRTLAAQKAAQIVHDKNPALAIWHLANDAMDIGVWGVKKGIPLAIDTAKVATPNVAVDTLLKATNYLSDQWKYYQVLIATGQMTPAIYEDIPWYLKPLAAGALVSYTLLSKTKDALTGFENILPDAFNIKPRANEAGGIVAHVLPGGYAVWITQNRSVADEAAKKAGGTVGDNGVGDAAVWEVYQSELPDNAIGSLLRGLTDIVNDPLSAVSLLELGTGFVKSALAEVILNPETSSLARIAARIGERGATGLELATKGVNVGSSLGLDLGLGLAERVGRGTGLFRPAERTTVAENREAVGRALNEATNPDTAVGARSETAGSSRNLAGRDTVDATGAATEAGVRTAEPEEVYTESGDVATGAADTTARETTPDETGAASTARTTTKAEPVTDDEVSTATTATGETVTPKAETATTGGQAPDRYQPREDGENFTSQLAQTDPAASAKLQNEMAPVWNQANRDMRSLGDVVSTPDHAILSSRVAQDTINAAQEIVGDDVTLPTWNLNSDKPNSTYTPMYTATERIIRSPWDTTTGERAFLYSGRTTNFPEAETFFTAPGPKRTYRGVTLLGEIPPRGLSGMSESQIAAANRYVDLVEQHYLWNPGDLTGGNASADFRRAWQQANTLDQQLRAAGRRATPGGDYYWAGNRALADYPVSRELGIAATPRGSTQGARGATEAGTTTPDTSAERTGQPRATEKPELTETTGNPHGLKEPQRTYLVDKETGTTVEITPTPYRSLSADVKKTATASQHHPWYEGVLRGDAVDDMPIEERTFYRPSLDSALQEATERTDRLLGREAEAPAAETATRETAPDTSTAATDEATTAATDTTEPETPKKSRETLGEQKSDQIVELATGRPPVKPDVPERAPKEEVPVTVEGGAKEYLAKAKGRTAAGRDVKVNGRDFKQWDIPARRDGTYRLDAPAKAVADDPVWNATDPQGKRLASNVTRDEAADIIDTEIWHRRKERTAGPKSRTVEETPSSEKEVATPAKGSPNRIGSAKIERGPHTPGLYDLAVDENNTVWLWDHPLSDPQVEALTKYEFTLPDGSKETYLDRLVENSRQIALKNKRFSIDQVRDRARMQTDTEYDKLINEELFPQRKNIGAKILRQRDAYLNMRRELSLATWWNAIRYPASQFMYNGMTMFLTGKWDVMPTFIRDIAPASRMRKMLKEGMTEERAAKVIKDEFSPLAQDMIDVGLDEPAYLRDVHKLVDLAKSDSNDLALTQWLEKRFGAVGGAAGKLVGSRRILHMGNAFDTAMRDSVGHVEFIRNFRMTRMQFKSDAFKAMEKKGVSKAERSRIWGEFERKTNKNGTFNPRLVQNHFAPVIGEGPAIRLSRDYTSGLHAMRTKIDNEVNRVAFTKGATKADTVLQRVMYFHYYNVRQSWLYARTAARHPFLINAYVNFLGWSDDQIDGLPGWMQGFIKVMALPGVGMGLFIDPRSLFTFYGQAADAGSDFINNPTKLTKANDWIKSHLMIDPLNVLSPDIKDILNIAGALGGAMPPDPLGLSTYVDNTMTVLNFARYLLPGGDTKTPIANFYDNWMGELREVVSGKNPLLDQKVKNVDQGDLIDRQIRIIAEDEAEKRGLDLNDPDDRKIFEAQMADHNSDLYKAAVGRYVRGETEELLARTVTPGALRMTGRYTVTADNKNSGKDIYTTFNKDQKSIANTVDPRAITLESQADAYYALNSDDDNTLISIHDGIVYGEMVQGVVYKGRYYTPDEINAMPDQQRKDLADAWMNQYGLTGRYYDAVDKQSAFKEDPKNKEFVQFKDWQKGVYAYDGGIDAYWADAVKTNESARDYYAWVDSQNFTPEERQSKLSSLTAFEWASGIQPDVYEGTMPIVNTTGNGSSDPLGIIGTPAKPDVPFESDYDKAVKEDVPKYLQDDKEWDQSVADQLQQDGYDPSTPFNTLPGYVRKQVEGELNDQGVYEPDIPYQVQNYIDWAEQQPMGADVSTDAYLAWDAQDYKDKAGARFDKESQSSNMMPSSSTDFWNQLLSLLNEHDLDRYPNEQNGVYIDPQTGQPVTPQTAPTNDTPAGKAADEAKKKLKK